MFEKVEPAEALVKEQDLTNPFVRPYSIALYSDKPVDSYVWAPEVKRWVLKQDESAVIRSARYFKGDK